MKELKRRYDEIPGDYYEKARLFRWWHRNRFSKALNLITSTKGSSLILDIGCDGGMFTQMLTQHGEVIGLDISQSFIENARRRYRTPHFLICDAQNLPLRESIFNIVTCLELLEHVPNPERVIKEVSRVLRSGGELILSVPNEENFLWRIIWFIWERVGRGIVWKNLHLTHFNQPSILSLLSDQFGNIKIKLANFRMILIIRGLKR